MGNQHGAQFPAAWVELRRERDGARVMETVVSYPGVKNCTAQRAMYIERPRVAEKRAYLALKRAFDISGALVGLAVLALPMSVIALIIALDSPGNPIFRQERLGKDGQAFTIYKFRTMYTYAPEDVATNSINVSAYTTGVGKFLRGYSIDELPQLWNVLRGDMSFVGYRPVCLSETAAQPASVGMRRAGYETWNYWLCTGKRKR